MIYGPSLIYFLGVATYPIPNQSTYMACGNLDENPEADKLKSFGFKSTLTFPGVCQIKLNAKRQLTHEMHPS